jgi:hypothetical protein
MSGPTRRDRPWIPDYGIPDTDEGLLDWAWARDRLRDAIVYWVSTTRPDGGPHAVPTWGAWLDDAFWMEGGTATRRARNLEAEPRVIVTIGGEAMAVIVGGVAERRPDPPEPLASELAEAFRKYLATPYAYEADPANWTSEAGGGLWVVRPRVVLGWQEFPTTCTRWHFD